MNKTNEWTGTFPELVARCNEYLRDAGSSERVNERLLRDYQARGLVNRGTPLDGRTRLFGEADVMSVLAAKGLRKQGVTLGMAERLLSTSNSGDVALYASTISPASANATASSNAAVQKVSELLSRSTVHEQTRATSLLRNAMIVNPPSSNPSPGKAAGFFADNPTQRQELSLGDLCRVSLAAPLGDGDRQALSDWISQIADGVRNGTIPSP